MVSPPDQAVLLKQALQHAPNRALFLKMATPKATEQYDLMQSMYTPSKPEPMVASLTEGNLLRQNIQHEMSGFEADAGV